MAREDSPGGQDSSAASIVYVGLHMDAPELGLGIFAGPGLPTVRTPVNEEPRLQ